MKIVVTGVAGFIGSKVAQALIEQGLEVIGVDDLSKGYLENVPHGCTFLQKDLADPDIGLKLPATCDVIMHLAGQSSGEISFDNPRDDLRKNVISTLNLICYGIAAQASKIVYASSMSAYGLVEDKNISEDTICQPLSCYGVGKLTSENYLKVYQKELPFVSFRMFNVYGPGQDMANLRQGMVSIFLAYALKGQEIPVKGCLNRFRDFIYVDDVVNAWVDTLNRTDIHNEVFNLGTGIRTTVEKLLLTIKQYVPETTWAVQNTGTPGDQFGIYADTTKLERYFGHINFKNLNEGMQTFVNWAQAHEGASIKA